MLFSLRRSPKGSLAGALFVVIVLFLAPPMSRKIRPCASRHKSLEQKISRIQEFNGAEILVLGGSLGESFHPADFDHIFGKKTFQGAIPQSGTMSRMVLLREALKTQSQLEHVFYIVDLAEWNESAPNYSDFEVSKSEAFKDQFSSLDLTVELEGKDVSSPQKTVGGLEKFQQGLACWGQGGGPSYNFEGLTSEQAEIRPMENLAAFRNSSAKGSQVDRRLKKKIRIQSRELLDGALKNFRLAAQNRVLFSEMAKLTEDSGVQLHFILPPLHPLLRDEFSNSKNFSDFGFEDSYFQWIQALKSLDSRPQVWVHDKTLGERVFPRTSMFWKNGTEFTQMASGLLILEVRQDMNPSRK